MSQNAGLPGSPAQWRSQVTDDARAMDAIFSFFFPFSWGVGRGEVAGWGHVPLVNFCILVVATQIVLEAIYEMVETMTRWTS